MAVYVLNTSKDYKVYQTEVDNILKNFDIDDIKGHTILLKMDSDVFNMPKSYYIVNLIFMKPFFFFKKSIKKEYLFNAKNIDNKTIVDYINDVIHPVFADIDIEILKPIYLQILNELSTLTALTNTYVGATIDLIDICHMMDDKEFLSYIDYHIDNVNDSIDKAERKLKNVSDVFTKYLKTHDNCLMDTLNCKVGIKEKQLRETFVSVGYKPDIQGNVITEPVNSSYIRGLNSAMEYFTNAVGTRKSLITNFKGVRQSGYFTRKLQLLQMDHVLAHDVVDCGTEHTIAIDVTDMNVLSALHRKKYIDPVSGKIKIVNRKTDMNLIGTKINIRNAITCKLSKDNKVCQTCYGGLYGVNKNYHSGILASLILTNQLTQTLLSSKHLLRVEVDNTDSWDGNLLKYFDILKNNIVSKPDNTLMFTLKKEYIHKTRFDKYFITDLSITDNGKQYNIKFPTKMYINEADAISTLQMKEFNKTSLSLQFITENNEFYKNMKQMLDILEHSGINKMSSYSELYNTVVSLIIDNGISLNSAHLELILSNLVRDSIDLTKKVDFSKKELAPYRMVKISDAILNSSQFLGLSYEQVRKQLINPTFYLNTNHSKIESVYN